MNTATAFRVEVWTTDGELLTWSKTYNTEPWDELDRAVDWSDRFVEFLALRGIEAERRVALVSYPLH